MPLHQGYTSVNNERKGYYQWGSSGKKYYYEPGNKRSRSQAKSRAMMQARAIEASKN